MRSLLALASLVLAAATLVSPARGGDASTEGDAFARILARAETVAPSERESLAYDVVALGGNVVERSFRELVANARAGGDGTGARDTVVRAVLRQVGPLRWRSILGSALDAAPDRAVLESACRVVGDAGFAQDLGLLVTVVRLDEGRACRDDVEDAVQRLLVRDLSGFEAVGALLPVEDEDACAPFVAGVERTRRVEAASALAAWAERHSTLRRTCLQHLSRLALALPKPVPDEIATTLRPLLERGDPVTLPFVIVCLGRLQDDASIPQFLRWLKEGEQAVRANALWALQYVTNLRLGEDPKAWHTWYADETAWWERSAYATFSMLRRGTKAEKVAALNAIAERRTGRHRLAAEVAAATEDRDPEIVALAAHRLGELGSAVAVPVLLDVLDTAHPACAEAAHAALRRITGRDLPAEPAACRAELGL